MDDISIANYRKIHTVFSVVENFLHQSFSQSHGREKCIIGLKA